MTERELCQKAVAMLDNGRTVVLDTSTAHRTASDWVYGFPELSGRRERGFPRQGSTFRSRRPR